MRSLLPQKAPSIELEVLRAGCLIVAITGFLWQLESIFRSIPAEEFTQHFFIPFSVAAMFVADLLLLVAFFSNNRTLIVVALRVPVALMVVFLALVSTYDDMVLNPHGNALWFAPFAGLSVAALALTAPLRLSLPTVFFVPGLVAIFNSMLLGHTFWIDMLADVGFNIINTFPFVVFSGAARNLSRAVDDTVAETRKVEEEANRTRIRAEGLPGFTAFVHDYVLAALSAVANGLKVDFTLDEAKARFFNAEDTMTVSRFCSILETRVRTSAPDCVIEADLDSSNRALLLPGEVANTLLLALSEVTRNSVKHAGSNVSRTCRIQVSAGHVEVEFVDDGVGFDVSAVDSASAGIRLSIKGRMESLEGGTAIVDSTPGNGTRVKLSWTGSTKLKEERSILFSRNSQLSLYSLMGMRIVYSWQFYASFLGVLMLVMLAGGQLGTAAGKATLACAAVLFGVLTLPSEDKLSTRRSVVLMVGTVVLTLVGLYQRIDPEIGWISTWHLSVVSLLCALFAVRGRPLFALLTIFLSVVSLDVVSMLGVMPNRQVVGGYLLVRSVMAAAGVMTSVFLQLLLKRVPESIEEYNRAKLDASMAREFEVSRQTNYQWLEQQVAPVFDAANMLETPTVRLRDRARLTEQHLRDVLRSPRLNNPALHQAIWDARERGVSVRLLDDRSHSNIDTRGISDVRQLEISNEPALIDSLMPVFLTAVDEAETGSVTIRLLPPGRRAFASVSDENGVQRFDMNGERL